MTRLVKHFGWIDERRRTEWEREQRRYAQLRANKDRQKQRREKEQDATDENIGAFAVAATFEEIEAFEVKLDTYDEAAVAALMENREQLDAVQARIELLLQQAYVMEDGRRVFKTEDGTQVFDEHGNEVSHDELDYDLISDDRPSWESYQTETEYRDALVAERQQIIEFQDKVAAAREETADGEISKDRLEELDADLAASVPPPVRAHMPGMEPLPEPTAAFARSAANPVIASASPTLDMPVSPQ